MPEDFNRQIIEEFRANQGQVGGMFEGGRLLLLTTTGARTGVRRTNPLAYLPDGTRRLVIASAGGAPRHPAWYHNLLAHPRVTVEDGLFTYEADAVPLTGAERDRLFARAAEADPGWAAYQARTTRVLPVVALTLAGPPPEQGPRGESLKRIHDVFRRELGIIRREVAASGPTLGAQLRVNCLSVCGGLEFHHADEDARMFPHLEDHRRELAPALERLREEHRVIQRLVGSLQDLVAKGRTPEVAAEILALTAEVEAHLDHEEEWLVPVLNDL
jgi:deazaflavin-dependent oxidoreductase (nitroreductase family)